MAANEVIERDNQGNIITTRRYDKDGNLVYTHVNEWEDGRMVRKTAYDKDGREIGSYPYEYDEKGNCVAGCWWQSFRGELMKTETVYDENDLAIEHTRFGKGSVATNKTFNSYDEKGRLTCEKYYGVWPDGELVYTYNEYDDNDLRIKTITKDENENTIRTTEFTYNEFGKVADYSDYDGEGKLMATYKYFYDENGVRQRLERYDGEGNLVQSGG